jgi:hypothetical protein
MTDDGSPPGDRLAVTDPATWSVALGQVGFAFFLAICVAIHPGLVLKVNEGGMSNYGVHAKTAIPYTLALAMAAGLTARTAG